MRIRILLLLGLSGSLLGGNCVPLFDLEPSRPDTGETLGVAVLTPAANRTVAVGDTVGVEWTAVNETADEAIVTILVESRPGLARTILVGGQTLDDSRGPRTFEWDTTGFDRGEYAVIASIEAGATFRESTASGKITLNGPPTFEFTGPTDDATLVPDDGITISWIARDPEGSGTVQIGIDPGPGHQTGNEVILAEENLPATEDVGSLVWDGTDKDGSRVDAGTYYLFALVDDGVTQARVVDGLARLTVPEWADGGSGTETAITEPAEDTDFVVGDADLHIAFDLVLTEDVLIDLKIDTDDDHGNGNETTILSQRSETSDTDADSFDWDGTDADGVDVDAGIYRVFLVVSTGVGTPETFDAEGLVFRRDDADQPLIGLLAPARVQTLNPGDYLTIRWQDDDPGANATIRIAIDDDKIPAEAVETDGAEIEILADREAEGDGVLDTYSYQIPSSLDFGTYYVFAYITSGGTVVRSHVSVAPAPFVLEDPAAGSGG